MLDVATGTGMVAAELLARADCSVVGIDQSARDARGGACALRRRCERSRVELVEGQAEALPFADASFDALTFTYLLRYVDDPRGDDARAGARGAPGRARRLAGVRRAAVAPARAAWRLYTAVGLPVLGRLASREWARGRALPRAEHPRLLRAPPAASGSSATGGRPGLEDVRVRRMSLGGGIVMSAGERRGGRDVGPRADGGGDGRSHGDA